MNDRTRLKFTATLVYDAETMHSGDRDIESRGWFLTEVLGGEHLCLHDNGELGDTIGSVEDLELVKDDDSAAELRAACEAAKSALTALDRVQMYGSADMVRDRAKRALDLIDAALAATEGES